jgi:hypothetical protein
MEAGRGRSRRATRKTAALDPAWAPDGSRIVFGTSSGAVDSIYPDGWDLTVLVDDGKSGEPAWQPTG